MCRRGRGHHYHCHRNRRRHRHRRDHHRRNHHRRRHRRDQDPLRRHLSGLILCRTCFSASSASKRKRGGTPVHQRTQPTPLCTPAPPRCWGQLPRAPSAAWQQHEGVSTRLRACNPVPMPAQPITGATHTSSNPRASSNPCQQHPPPHTHARAAAMPAGAAAIAHPEGQHVHVLRHSIVNLRPFAARHQARVSQAEHP